MIRSRCVAWAAPIASSSPSSSWAGCPNALSAPTLMSASRTLRLARRRSIRVQKSVSERKCAALAAGRDDRFDGALADVLDGEQPEPDRVAFDRELEMAERWTSGGRTSMAIRRHSATAAATFSSFERKAVSTAVM